MHADQHLDRQENVFFQRIEWECSTVSDPPKEGTAFQEMAQSELGMYVKLGYHNDRPRIGIMVSKADHCLHDLALRVRSGEWNAELTGVLSNHRDLQKVADSYQLSFQYFNLTPANKAEEEAKQIKWIQDQKIELLVLARYMQILSKDFLANADCPVRRSTRWRRRL